MFWPHRPGSSLSCHVAGRRASISKKKTMSETCRSPASCPLPEADGQREEVCWGRRRKGAMRPPVRSGVCFWLTGTPPGAWPLFENVPLHHPQPQRFLWGGAQAGWQGPQLLSVSKERWQQLWGQAPRAERASPPPPPTAEGAPCGGGETLSPPDARLSLGTCVKSGC